jgi:hypothetical protein
MAETITLTYSAGNLSRARTFPNGSGARVVAAAKARLDLDPSSTNAQVFNAVADEFFNVLRATTLNYEREQARIAADAGVPDMPLT